MLSDFLQGSRGYALQINASPSVNVSEMKANNQDKVQSASSRIGRYIEDAHFTKVGERLQSCAVQGKTVHFDMRPCDLSLHKHRHAHRTAPMLRSHLRLSIHLRFAGP